MTTFRKKGLLKNFKKQKDQILESIFEGSTTPVLVIDENDAIIMKNPAAKTFFYMEEAEEIAFSDLFEITKEDAKRLFAQIRRDAHKESCQLIAKGKSAICKVHLMPMGKDIPYLQAFVYDRTEDYRTIENLKRVTTALEQEVRERTKEVENIALSAVTTIANYIDSKEEYNFGHSTRVARYAEAIAREIGWSAEEALNLHYVALLHDIGKIGVPLQVLNKQTPLEVEELFLIREHTIIGAEILKDIKTVREVSTGALYHHERFDGTGYPEGLKGQEIPLVARIIGIADAYDAMTSKREYKTILSDEEVKQEIIGNAGLQFDPYLASVVSRMIEEGIFEPLRDKQEEMTSDNIIIESSELMAKVMVGELKETKAELEHDDLTKLWNYKNGEKHIKEYLRLGDGALLIIDLDDFTMLNDSFGQSSGDKVLKEVADVLRAHGRNEYVCRISGDEFLVFIRDVVSQEETKTLLDAILYSFNSRQEQDELLAHTSLSVGIALSSVEGRDYKNLFRCADRALYFVKQSKKGGYSFHNRVTLHNS